MQEQPEILVASEYRALIGEGHRSECEAATGDTMNCQEIEMSLSVAEFESKMEELMRKLEIRVEEMKRSTFPNSIPTERNDR
ncbi:hypothetical protein PPTG_23954 [Phytophthora nicotianae INRA-310]|uniref:Uncharacterized protein n=1 Tax=Phytophthora nicotianae (strain INRA-310) TaxID=761204 RepID=W2PME6_PHYN3|nr:hypothetical protein PPTG_23954 [Phytophthora nicotianae INRA-310]ETN02178.1 hypothetical protein PPTG_23954 [Phytophthora nicotianae INRA-310]